MFKQKITLIILVGFVLRILFILFVADAYFGRPNFMIDGDTSSWVYSFINWWEKGIYSIDLNHEYGYFARTPAYSMFFGIFYLLCGKNLELSYHVIAYAQIILDSFTILGMFLIGRKLFNQKMGYILAILYASYPFIIVWNPVIYSETLSIITMIWGLYFFISEKKSGYMLSGLFISLAILSRPHLALIIIPMGLYMLILYHKNIKKLIVNGLRFFLVISIVYGSWPARNYFLYNKLIISHNWNSAPTWTKDVQAFYLYIYSVKAEWEPQFSNILKNKQVSFPPNAYHTKEDSVKLEKVIEMCKTCGSGFSHWRGYWKEHFVEPNCNEEIAQLFTELRENQIKAHPLNFYLWLPLQNLKKAIFKISLYDTSTFVRKLASVLFLWRTALIILGLIGTIMLLRKRIYFAIIPITYFVILYGLLCFGTDFQFRNIEMRYFLPADILMLIPAGYLINNLYQKIKVKLTV